MHSLTAARCLRECVQVVETEAVQAVLRKHRDAMQRCFLTFAAGEIDFDEVRPGGITSAMLKN